MFTYYKLGSHVLELETRPCVLGVLRPIVIKWLKPGWRDEWDEVVRRMDAGSVTPIRLTDDETARTPEAVAIRAPAGKSSGSMRGTWQRFLPEPMVPTLPVVFLRYRPQITNVSDKE